MYRAPSSPPNKRPGSLRCNGVTYPRPRWADRGGADSENSTEWRTPYGEEVKFHPNSLTQTTVCTTHAKRRPMSRSVAIIISSSSPNVPQLSLPSFSEPCVPLPTSPAPRIHPLLRCNSSSHPCTLSRHAGRDRTSLLPPARA
jgi:hypothetical protein